MEGKTGYLFQEQAFDYGGNPTGEYVDTIRFFSHIVDYLEYEGKWTKIVYFKLEEMLLEEQREKRREGAEYTCGMCGQDISDCTCGEFDFERDCGARP